MKRQHIVSMVIASAWLFAVGITLAAQDRFTLKTPNGIAFSEFRLDEIAEAAVFLTSVDSSYVTGTRLFSDGGFGQICLRRFPVVHEKDSYRKER